MQEPTGGSFFTHPILNSPYECPKRHWELSKDTGQPTGRVIEGRRAYTFITPFPKATGRGDGGATLFDSNDLTRGLFRDGQEYRLAGKVDYIRAILEKWRAVSDSRDWGVTPETAALLKRWRHHKFTSIRLFLPN